MTKTATTMGPAPRQKPYRPVLTDAARPATFDVAATDEHGVARTVPIAGEHPLTLYVDKREILTIMTLGAAPEALAIGYLRNQRLVTKLEDIASVQVDWDTESVVVTTRGGLEDLEAKTAKRTTTTGCGQGTVFGDLMEEIDRVKLPAGGRLTRAALYDLLDRVRHDRRRAGGEKHIGRRVHHDVVRYVVHQRRLLAYPPDVIPYRHDAPRSALPAPRPAF